MKIIYLSTQIFPYNISTIYQLAEFGNEIHIIEKNNSIKKEKKFLKKKIYFYKKLNYNFFGLINFIKKINPKIIVIVGWQELIYVLVVFFVKNKNTSIVIHSDNKWTGKLKQHIARFLGLFSFFYLFFDKVWIHGPFQFEYVRKIGFKAEDIFFDHASADVDLFHDYYQRFLVYKKKSYPKVFLFLGRIEKIKGLETLLNSWDELTRNKENQNWKLKIIGDGSFKIANKIAKNKLQNVEILGFMSHKDLANQIKNAGCFILPSINEPWGVVVHEMCSAGLPLILSETVGSRYAFLIDKTNGFTFKKNNHISLKMAMMRIIRSSDQELMLMSKISHELSFRINPRFSALSLISMV
jgi:glycosyltransferase involved in cell wall biosynthesis